MSGVSLKTHNNYESFEKLYKQLYGKDFKKGDTISRTDEMSNRDWDLFQNYFNQKNAVNDETETFNQTKQNLDDREREARIQADIQMDRLNKYLPQQMRNRGLAGATDLTESALIQAKNNYQNQLGKINNDYTGYQQELLNNYNKNLRTIGNNYESKAESINATHDAISQNAYDLLMEKLAEYSTTTDDLAQFEKYYLNNDKSLSDEHRDLLEKNVGVYKDSIQKQLYQKAQADINTAMANGATQQELLNLSRNYGLNESNLSSLQSQINSAFDVAKGATARDKHENDFIQNVTGWVKNVVGGNDSVVTINGKDISALKLQDPIFHGKIKGKLNSAFPNAKNGDVKKYNNKEYAFVDGIWYELAK